MKKIVEPRTHHVPDMYKYYIKKYEPTKRMNKTKAWMYREVLSRYNKKVSDLVIFGQVLNLQNRLGYIRIRKIKRNYENPIVDWAASRKNKADIINSGGTPRGPKNPAGKDWVTLFDDPWYLRWAWVKRSVCKVRNHTVYKFTPTANKSKKAGDNSLDKLGNRGKLALANKANPLLHTQYEYFERNNYKTRHEREQIKRKKQNKDSTISTQEYEKQILSSS